MRGLGASQPRDPRSEGQELPQLPPAPSPHPRLPLLSGLAAPAHGVQTSPGLCSSFLY